MNKRGSRTRGGRGSRRPGGLTCSSWASQLSFPHRLSIYTSGRRPMGHQPDTPQSWCYHFSPEGLPPVTCHTGCTSDSPPTGAENTRIPSLSLL